MIFGAFPIPAEEVLLKIFLSDLLGEEEVTLCVMGAQSGPLGALFVLTDWRVRVFGSSGLVARPYDHLSIWTIPPSGCMEIQSRYTPFFYQA